MSLINVTDQGSDPSSPAVSEVTLYTKAGRLYSKDSAGTVVEYEIVSGGGGGDLEVFFSAGKMDKANGDHAVTEVKAGKDAEFSFHIPADFATLVEVALQIIPDGDSDGPGQDIDLASDYGAVGTDKATHSEANTTGTFDLGTADFIEEIDLSSVFSSLSAGDSCGVNVANNTGGLIGVKCVRLKYSQ